MAIDGFLNFYFMRVVRANLVKNGLEKYNKLVQFNKHMIVISLLTSTLRSMTRTLHQSYAQAHSLRPTAQRLSRGDGLCSAQSVAISTSEMLETCVSIFACQPRCMNAGLQSLLQPQRVWLQNRQIVPRVCGKLDPARLSANTTIPVSWTTMFASQHNSALKKPV